MPGCVMCQVGRGTPSHPAGHRRRQPAFPRICHGNVRTLPPMSCLCACHHRRTRLSPCARVMWRPTRPLAPLPRHRTAPLSPHSSSAASLSAADGMSTAEQPEQPLSRHPQSTRARQVVPCASASLPQQGQTHSKPPRPQPPCLSTRMHRVNIRWSASASRRPTPPPSNKDRGGRLKSLPLHQRSSA